MWALKLVRLFSSVIVSDIKEDFFHFRESQCEQNECNLG